MRYCPKCDRELPLDAFYTNKAARDGYCPYCKECSNAYAVERQRKDPAKLNARHKAWRCKNPEKAAAHGRKAASARRARIRDAFVEHVDPLVVFQRDEGVCGICTEPVDRGEFDVDHIVPLAEGGEHSYANVRLSHVNCNRSRGRGTALVARKEG